MDNNQPEDLSMSGSAAKKRNHHQDEESAFEPQSKKSNNSDSFDSVDAVKISSNNAVDVEIAATKKEQELFKTFKGFKVDSVLSNSADYKRIVVEGTVNGQEKAVIILDKKPFTEDILSDLFSEKSELIHTFQNDIYGSYDCLAEPKLSGN
jgi:hypothetical protein